MFKELESPFKINGHLITSYDYNERVGYRFFNSHNRLVCTIEDDNGDKAIDELVRIYGDAIDVEPELPTELTISGDLLIDDFDNIGEAYLDEAISDWLSDECGFVHLGFDYDIVDGDVHVTNIKWDTSD